MNESEITFEVYGGPPFNWKVFCGANEHCRSGRDYRSQHAATLDAIAAKRRLMREFGLV